MKEDRTAFIQFRGKAGDRNPFGMTGAAVLGNALANRYGIEPQVVGTPTQLSEDHQWAHELDAARPGLKELSSAYESVLMSARSPITTMGRCACALATLPVIARMHHDATIVWFDAHGDSNTPTTSASGYLGGMVLAAAAGMWDSGLGSGLRLANVVLVGARDLDPAEQKLIDAGAMRHVAAGDSLFKRMDQILGHAPVYVHIDCDVLDPGIVPTEFTVDDGLTVADLHGACELLSTREVIGLEIAEFQSVWSDSGVEASPRPIVDAVSPLIEAILAN
ncbi:MAG TPA: arginase family protein [Steroidobacteraceae bacterium]|nr:arginase family protein [Steroidobacteraceae bacterium]